MMTLSMLQRFTACCAAAVVIAGAAAASRPAGQPETARQAARDSGSAMAEIMREARNGKLVVSHEIDGRIVIDAVSPAGARSRGDMRIASLP